MRSLCDLSELELRLYASIMYQAVRAEYDRCINGLNEQIDPVMSN